MTSNPPANERKRARLLELVGVPGSGKSFIAKRLVARLPAAVDTDTLKRFSAAHYHGTSPARTAAIALPFLARYPGLSLRLVIDAGWRHRSNVQAVRRFAATSHLIRTAKSHASNPSSILLADEFIIHQLAIARAEAAVEVDQQYSQLVARCLEATSCDCTIVHVHVPLATAVSRVQNRLSESHYDRWDSERLTNHFRRVEAVNDKLLGYLKSSGYEVLTVSGHPEATTGAVDAIVNQLSQQVT